MMMMKKTNKPTPPTTTQQQSKKFDIDLMMMMMMNISEDLPAPGYHGLDTVSLCLICGVMCVCGKYLLFIYSLSSS
jgi:hypothetical protein